MLTIVTAADGNHFATLLGAVVALRRTEMAHARVVVYDLGLRPCQAAYLKGTAACLSGGATTDGAAVVVRSFPFHQYPSHFNISQQAGSYAWKPAIVALALQETAPGGAVVWCDAGTEMSRRLSMILGDSESFAQQGFISSVTTGTMQQWVHRGMVEWFEAQPQQRSAVRAMIERERFAGRNCNGAFLGIKKDLHGAASSVMPMWVECALNRSCIAPEGSSRRNHRQDQAALTMLTKLRLPPSSGCQPLRSDGSMRFWRDQYYDVNSPVHFAELKRTATACTDDRQRRRAFEAGKANAILSCSRNDDAAAVREVVVVVVLSLTAQDTPTADERRLEGTIASTRQSFLASSNAVRVHVLVLLAASADRARLERVEASVGADSFVSVVSRRNDEAIRPLLNQYDDVFLCVSEATNGDLVTFPSDLQSRILTEYGEDEMDRGGRRPGLVFFRGSGAPSSICGLVGSRDRGAVIDAVLRSLDQRGKESNEFLVAAADFISNLQGVRCGEPQQQIRRYESAEPPLLVPESATGDKASQIRNKKRMRALPSQGVTLALLAEHEIDRSRLALACLLMGSLGFGVRWKDGLLGMRDLERLDKEIFVSTASSSALSRFAQKSKKEVKHAPWVMFSERLPRTIGVWKEHLGTVICVVYERKAGNTTLTEGCGMDKYIVRADGFTNAGLYYLFQHLNAIVGNLRALSREEVSIVVSDRRKLPQ
jgi:hypothetical protein